MRRSVKKWWKGELPKQEKNRGCNLIWVYLSVRDEGTRVLVPYLKYGGTSGDKYFLSRGRDEKRK